MNDDLAFLASGSPATQNPNDASGEDRQSTAHIKARAKQRQNHRLRALRAVKAENYAEIDPGPLADEESMHFISRGQFDTITIIAHHAQTIGRIDRFTASSLSISKGTIDTIGELQAAGLLGQVRITVQDLTMKRSEHREHIDGIRHWMHNPEGENTLRVSETHAKVYVLEFADDSTPLVLESSANLTSNDRRLEQYTLTRSADLAQFHLGWLDEIFNYPDGKLPRNAFPGDPRLAQ